MTVQRGQAELKLPYRTGEDGILGITKGKRVDVTGIKAIADALRVSGSVTKLNLCDNNLGAEDEAVLHKAVEGRSGFKLEL